MVVSNCNGELMVVASKRVHGNFTPKTTKLMTACLGLKVASQMGYESLVLEMDAQDVIRCLNASEECLDSDGALVVEAQAYLQLFPVVICQYASRCCNYVACHLASRALLCSDFHVWIEEGTMWLSTELLFDVSDV